MTKMLLRPPRGGLTMTATVLPLLLVWPLFVFGLTIALICEQLSTSLQLLGGSVMASTTPGGAIFDLAKSWKEMEVEEEIHQNQIQCFKSVFLSILMTVIEKKKNVAKWVPHK